jgi:sirohydrochlorin ferrochelatase
LNPREKRVKVLIIASHGSRKRQSNIELADLTERVSKKFDKESSEIESFERIEHAFLQFAEPLLEKKIEQLVKDGATKIVIFPFFIGSGNHILVDIPELIKKMQQNYDHVEFKVTRHLGKIEAIEDVIIQEVMN